MAQKAPRSAEVLASATDSESALRLLGEARTWHTQGRMREQKQACEAVLKHLPEHFEALHLLGFHAQTEGDFALAQEYYRRALLNNPGFAFSKLALSQLRMMQSGFREGRESYEARFEAMTEGSGPDWRGLPIPRWRGEILAGKHLYIWAEQGLGDMIMFSGFLPRLLAEIPARVALGMFPKLVSLFARSFLEVQVESIDLAACHALAPAAQAALPGIKALASRVPLPFALEPLQAAYDYRQRHGAFDYAAPLGDLMVRYMPEYIPAEHPPHLVADAARVSDIRKKLAATGGGRRIGISWRTTNARELSRNTALADWLPVLKTPGCTFVSLQHHVSAVEIERFCNTHNCRIQTPAEIDLVQDAEGLAALATAMDEVITIDNSNAHFAGALGVKTTLLLPKGCNYRWPQRGDNGTFWYRSVTALRQEKPGDWQPVMEECAQALASP